MFQASLASDWCHQSMRPVSRSYAITASDCGAAGEV
jgi:hypothetical protein